jgi:hypothetical protein
VKTLLDRLDALGSSPERKATRKADHAALSQLEKKGYTKEERNRLRGLIEAAERVADTRAPLPVPGEETVTEAPDWTRAKVAGTCLAKRSKSIKVNQSRSKTSSPQRGYAPTASGGRIVQGVSDTVLERRLRHE